MNMVFHYMLAMDTDMMNIGGHGLSGSQKTVSRLVLMVSRFITREKINGILY